MANPLICVFNPVTSLIDEVQSISLGPAAVGVPIVTNVNGVIDSSLLGLGNNATAGQSLSSGTLVNLYSASGTLHAQIASAQNGGGSPPAGSYPLAAQGFAATSVTLGSPVTVSFFGTFKYIDGNSEFNASNIGQEVFLSDRGDGSVTLTPPSGVGELEQSVGYVVAFTSPNNVTINFASGFQDFTHISGVNPVTKGGTGATTGAQALINLIGTASVGQALVWNGSAWVPGTDVTTFQQIASGTNNTATMTVSTGASLGTSGSGTIAATSTPFSGLTTSTNVSATLTVGTGATLTFSGTGTINANQLTGITISGTPTTGQVLTATSASTANWQSPSGSPAAPSTSVQFNNAGAFGGSANFTWTDASASLNVGNGFPGIDTTVAPTNTFLNVVGRQLNSTGTSGNSVLGINTQVSYQGSANVSANPTISNQIFSSTLGTDGIAAIMGLEIFAASDSSSNQSVGNLTGLDVIADYGSTGTCTTFTGIEVNATGNPISAGQATNFYGIHIQSPQSATNLHGTIHASLLVDDPKTTGVYTNTYAILTHGEISSQPTGHAAVAITATGDAFTSDILQFKENGGATVLTVDQYGETVIHPVTGGGNPSLTIFAASATPGEDILMLRETGGVDVTVWDQYGTLVVSPVPGGANPALSVTGENTGTNDVFLISSSFIGGTIRVVQNGVSSLNTLFNDGTDTISIFPNQISMDNGGVLGDTIQLGLPNGHTGTPDGMSITVFNKSTGGRTSPFGSLAVWGDAWGNNIQNWFVNGAGYGGPPAVVPAVQIDTLGGILAGLPDYQLNQTVITDTNSQQANAGHRFVTTNTTLQKFATSTSVQITSDVVTIQATNTFTAGEMIELFGFVSASFLNGQTVKVLATGLSGSQFEFEFSHINYGPTADTGTAQDYSVNESVSVFSQIDPSAGNQFVTGLDVTQALTSTSTVLGGAQVFPQGLEGYTVRTNHEGTGNITSVTPSSSYPWYAIVGGSVNVNNFNGASVPNAAALVLDIGQSGGSHMDNAYTLFLTSNGDATGTITNSYNIYIQRQNSSSATNRFAIYEVNPQEQNVLGQVDVGSRLQAIRHTPYAYTSPQTVIEADSPAANPDFAGQATVLATTTSIAVTFVNNYTGTNPPVVVVVPTSNPTAPTGGGVYWVTTQGGAGAWTGFTINVNSAPSSNETFNYMIVGQV